MYWRVTGEIGGNRVETELPIGLDAFPDVEKTYTHARKHLSKILHCKHHGDANLKVSMVHCDDEPEPIHVVLDNSSGFEVCVYHENKGE